MSVSNLCHEQSLPAHCVKDIKMHLGAPCVLPPLTNLAKVALRLLKDSDQKSHYFGCIQSSKKCTGGRNRGLSDPDGLNAVCLNSSYLSTQVIVDQQVEGNYSNSVWPLFLLLQKALSSLKVTCLLELSHADISSLYSIMVTRLC